VPTLSLKKVFSTCQEKFCSISGAPVDRLLDEGMRQERAMLAQAQTKSKARFGNSNGQPDKSDGLDPQFAKLKKELTLAQREISNLKNQLHQPKENITKERVEHCSKSKKDDSPDEEVGSKRHCQQAKRAKASRPGTSPPSPPRKDFKIFPTGNNSDSEEEDDYPEPNARATYAKAKFARIQPTIQKKTSRLDVEPGPARTRAGQVITHTHQRLIDLAMDSLQEDDYSGLPDLETNDDDQEGVNVVPQFEVQNKSMIEFMHNINIMIFPDEIIRTNKQTGQIVLLRNIVRGPIEPTVKQLESWAVSDNGASEAFNMYEANDIWTQHGLDPRVNTCRRMIWLRRVGMFLDYKIAYSKDSECTESLDVFSPADALHVKYPLSPITIYATKPEVEQYKDCVDFLDITEIGQAQAMMSMVRHENIGNLQHVSTDIVRMHMDPEFWYQQHTFDSYTHHIPCWLPHLRTEMLALCQSSKTGNHAVKFCEFQSLRNCI
jgi:hypothetical protein